MAVYSLEGVAPSVPKSEDYWIAPDAAVIGNVILAENVSVWWGAKIRGDSDQITIGEGTNIQDNSVLHTDAGFPLKIGINCTIGHKVMLHGCIIGDNSLVGMGATILNGTVIGNNCLIGAGALLSEKKHIPDNSLVVGMPGKVIREIDKGTVEAMKLTAQTYIKNWRKYQSGLKRNHLNLKKRVS